MPSGKGLVDPIGDLLKSAKQAELQKAGDSKYDPLPGLLKTEAQQRGENDTFGNFVRSLTQMDVRAMPGSLLLAIPARQMNPSMDKLESTECQHTNQDRASKEEFLSFGKLHFQKFKKEDPLATQSQPCNCIWQRYCWQAPT